MSGSGPEAAVVRKTQRLCKDRGAVVHKTQGTMNTRGEPDLVGCHRGMFVAFECKAPTLTPSCTPLQAARIAEYRAAGGVAMVFDDAGEVEWVLDRIETGQDAGYINRLFDEKFPWKVVGK